MLVDAEIVRKELLANLAQEAEEILSMVVASIKTARERKR